MSYIIKNNLSGAFAKVKSNDTKGTWATLLKNATKFKTLDDASIFIEQRFSFLYPGFEKANIKIICAENILEEYGVVGEDLNEESAAEMLQEMITFFEDLVKTTDKFISLPGYYGKAVKQCDMETLDILHKIEFTNENVVNGFKLYKQLQDVRLRRRKAKDALEFSVLISSSGLISDLKQIASDIHTLKESEENRKYKPRALPGLFDYEECG